MATDNMLAEEMPSKPYDAVLRFYQWNPPAISLGFHQSINIVKYEECARIGWDVVRRPTGGRALLHNADLSYAVVFKVKDDKISTLKSVYNEIGCVISSALGSLNVNVDKDIKNSEKVKLKPHNNLCLRTRTRSEITVNKRKIVGNAQRLYPNAVLQHGSITLSGDVADIAKVIDYGFADFNIIVKELRSSAIALNEAADREVSFNELYNVFKKTFVEFFNCEVLDDELTPSEIDKINNMRGMFDIFSISDGFNKNFKGL